MEERILFATHCQWLKYDLDPQSMKEISQPMVGTLFVTDSALKFSGGFKQMTGHNPFALVTSTRLTFTDTFWFAMPLAQIRGVEAIERHEAFLFLKEDMVFLKVTYQAKPPDGELKALGCIPHTGMTPPDDPQSILVAPEIASLYQPGVARAYNWERILKYLIGRPVAGY